METTENGSNKVANKVRRQLEKVAYVLRAREREREANLTSNLPADRNKESAPREVAPTIGPIPTNHGQHKSSGTKRDFPLDTTRPL